MIFQQLQFHVDVDKNSTLPVNFRRQKPYGLAAEQMEVDL